MSKEQTIVNAATSTHSLPVQLTPEEVRIKGAEVAVLLGKRGSLVLAKKHATKVYADEIKEIDAKLDELAAVVRQGRENREVECREHLDFGERVARLKRLDTMEVISTRPLKNGELQGDFFKKQQPIKEVQPAKETSEAKAKPTNASASKPKTKPKEPQPKAKAKASSSKTKEQPKTSPPVHVSSGGKKPILREVKADDFAAATQLKN